MFSSFTSALAALKGHSAAVDAIGHNLANVNTSGFKAMEVAFKDLVAQSMGGQSELGMGVGRPLTVRNFTQGAIQASSGPMNAALQGNGFFVVRGDSNSDMYTRDGSFHVDKTGVLRTLTGERVQGYNVSASGVMAPEMGDIVLPAGTLPAQATTTMSVFANLDINTAVGGKFNSTVEVVDSLGKTHVVTTTFTKTGANSWTMQASMPPGETAIDAEEAAALLGDPIELEFDENGTLSSPELEDGVIDLTLPDLLSGASDLTMKLNLYDANKQPTISQVSAASSTGKTFQDGVRAGQIVDVGMADEGRIIARYDSGEERIIAQLGVAITTNPDSLQAAGNNLFRAGADTAKPVVGLSGQGGRGSIKGGSLEASTVDIAREFTNLIVYQRGYQANSRVITTADELSQETLNLKR